MLTGNATRAYLATQSEQRPRVSPAVTRDLTGSLAMIGAGMPFARNTEIYGEGEPAEYIYKVVSGAVRTYTLLSDGRRQIGAFHLPGDIFGLEAGKEHCLSAEAILDSKILVIKRATLALLASRDSDVASELWALTAQHLDRAQKHMLLLGRRNAQERVAAFLLEIAARVPASDTIELPMSRQDIADYLGLTIETVSRTFTCLENSDAIALPSSRRILLRNRVALQRLNA